MSYQVFDEQGRIWPPGFESQLLNPASRHCILSPNQVQRLKASEASRQTGKGWGTGTMPHMQSPIITHEKRRKVGA